MSDGPMTMRMAVATGSAPADAAGVNPALQPDARRARSVAQPRSLYGRIAYSRPAAWAAGIGTRSGQAAWILAAACALALVFLLLRNVGLYPTVFGDEYLYSKHSRLLPLGESILPGYLYLAVYRVTNVCGNGFLECARVLNAGFFVAGAAFVYLTARRAVGERGALIVAILALVAPMSSYTAYFMPESFYFLGFWVFAWVLTGLAWDATRAQWAACGVVLGLLALIKPHALLLFPGLLLYLGYLHLDAPARGRRWLAASAILAGSALATKLALGYALAGRAGVTLFGTMYGSVSASCTSNFAAAAACVDRLAPPFLQSLAGHLLAIGFLFGLPLALAFAAAFQPAPTTADAPSADGSAQRRIAFLCVSLIVTMIGVTAAFTALMGEQVRLHQRYYDFAFPLFYIVCAGCLEHGAAADRRWPRYATAGVICALLAFVAYTNFLPYTPGYVETPEVRGLHAVPRVFFLACAMFAFTTLLWAARRTAGVRVHFYLVLPLLLLFSAVQINSEVRQRMVPFASDKVGLFIKQYLDRNQLDKLFVAGSNPGDLWRVVFHADVPNASFQLIPPGSSFDRTKVPPGKDWILLLGEHEVAGDSHFQISNAAFRLLPATDAIDVDFNDTNLSALVEVAQGLVDAKPYGAWSAADVVRFKFAGPLPERFALTLVAHPFGPNLGREFKVRVGDSESSFVLAAKETSRVELAISNPGKSRELSIKVPAPTSPKALGMNGDTRTLGIGLVRMTIKPL